MYVLCIYEMNHRSHHIVINQKLAKKHGDGSDPPSAFLPNPDELGHWDWDSRPKERIYRDEVNCHITNWKITIF